jgi:transcriptional regulator of acetoin/glycerol metabolism
MSTTHTGADRQAAHALALRARGASLPREGVPAPEILDSWARCLQAGLDPAAPVSQSVVEAADLARRRDHAEVVRRLAQGELETLAQQIAGSDYLLAFADCDGVILDVYADNRFALSGGGVGIGAGSCWAELQCGTNGLGTALAGGHSIAVTGSEHFHLRLGRLSCTATPVRDAHGKVVGALDASSYFESRQRHTQALVLMAARNIENRLLKHQMRSHLVLAIHPMPEFLGTLSAGLLAFDEAGSLLALNERGRHLLQGLSPAPGVAFEALFSDTFELLLARLHRGADAPLRDRMGRSLVAHCVSRPPEHRKPRRTAPTVLAQGPQLAPRGPGWAQACNDGGPAEGVTGDAGVAEAYRLAASAVRMQAPILIHGETGSGKELLARHAHWVSGRQGAFVAVNCGALPTELFEAELFGYAGGAYTGARRDGSVGLIASADGGTLLLDEVRELPPPVQASLLRFLDDRMVRPVGGTFARRVDVQLLAATHADLDDEVAAGRFRADLYYRLNTVRVDLPPLRRRSDFSAALRHVLGQVDPGADIDDEAVECLSRHTWPGNFRELRSVLTRALLAGGRRGLQTGDFAGLVPVSTPVNPPAASAAPATPGGASILQQVAADTVRREFERTGGSVSQTSRNLGISRTTVYRHLGRSRPSPDISRAVGRQPRA